MVPFKFPEGHPLQGKETGFPKKILKGTKLHLIRPYTEKIVEMLYKLNTARLEVIMRYLPGDGQKYSQIELMKLQEANYQLLEIDGWKWKVDGRPYNATYRQKKLITNDGLTPYQFTHWFPKKSKLIIIHLTKNLNYETPKWSATKRKRNEKSSRSCQ